MERRDGVRRWLRGTGLAVLLGGVPLQACDRVLEVTDPDIILEANSAGAALAIANGAIFRLTQAMSGIEGADNLFMFGGLLADEWRSGDTFVQRNNQDQRIFQPDNTFNDDLYLAVNRPRVQAEAAIRALRTFTPDSTRLIGLMFAVMAYVETAVGEHYCNGHPLSGLDEGGQIVTGAPITNDSIFRRAVAHADSAIAQAAGAEGASVRSFASIVKGRALVDLGQYAAAAAAVAGIPKTFKWSLEHSITTVDNEIWGLNNDPKRYTMVDREGGNGLDFISANDPRLPNVTGPDRIFDSALPLLVTRQGIYGQESDVPIATGLEARLIIAEALFNAGDRTAWLDTLNALRTDTTLYPPIEGGQAVANQPPFVRGPRLAAIADTFADDRSRIYTHFRERAFWMFSTGHRLGDMRRMIRQYGSLGFAPDNVFPVGPYFKGGSFGSAVNMPVPFEETNNPNFTQCIDVNP
ncbi:MAG TPA: hypothetical protein VNI61_00960 [Gemmatimonadales bacterium]|nr:hypothetical protein [Gemmatimonadales bacterium]